MLLSNVCRISNSAAATAKLATSATASVYHATTTPYTPMEADAAICANLEYAAFLGPYRGREASEEHQQTVSAYATYYYPANNNQSAANNLAGFGVRAAPKSAPLYRMVPNACGTRLVSLPVAAVHADEAQSDERYATPTAQSSLISAVATAVANAAAAFPRRGLEPTTTLAVPSAPFSTSATPRLQSPLILTKEMGAKVDATFAVSSAPGTSSVRFSSAAAACAPSTSANATGETDAEDASAEEDDAHFAPLFNLFVDESTVTPPVAAPLEYASIARRIYKAPDCGELVENVL